MTDATEAKAPSSSQIFRNLAGLLKYGFFPGETAYAVAEAIRFCEQVATTEEAKAAAAEAKPETKLEVVGDEK